MYIVKTVLVNNINKKRSTKATMIGRSKKNIMDLNHREE